MEIRSKMCHGYVFLILQGTETPISFCMFRPNGHFSQGFFLTSLLLCGEIREFDKNQDSPQKRSWDITTQCQQAWHSLQVLPGASGFLISENHPLILHPQLRLLMRQDTPDSGFVRLTWEIKSARRTMRKKCSM